MTSRPGERSAQRLAHCWRATLPLCRRRSRSRRRPRSPSTTTAGCWCGGPFRSRCPRAPRPSGSRSARSTPPRSSRSTPTVTIIGPRYDGAVDEAQRAAPLGRASGWCSGCRSPKRHAERAGARRRSAPAAAARRAHQLQRRPALALYPSRCGRRGARPPSLRLESARAQDQLRLGYFTGGASWQASYQVVLGADGRPGDGHGGARIRRRSGPRTPRSSCWPASVGRAQPRAPAVPMQDRAAWPAQMPAWTSFATEQRVGEFHLYSLPGRSTLLPGLTTSVALFEPAQVKYERNYVVHGHLPFWGFLPQQGDETEPPVEVIYTLKRPRKTDFGDRPLPGGVARLYPGRTARAGCSSWARRRWITRRRARTSSSTPAPRSTSPPSGCRPATPPGGTAPRPRRPHRRDRGLSGHAEERDRQRRHRGRAGGAGRRVERVSELGAGGEGLVHHHPLPGEGAGARRGGTDLSRAGDLVRLQR